MYAEFTGIHINFYSAQNRIAVWGSGSDFVSNMWNPQRLDVLSFLVVELIFSLSFFSARFWTFHFLISAASASSFTGIDESQKSKFESRKRNLKFWSRISRVEREIWDSDLEFREEKEKFEIPISNFESRKRNFKFLFGIQEHKEKFEIIISCFEKRNRELIFF